MSPRDADHRTSAVASLTSMAAREAGDTAAGEAGDTAAGEPAHDAAEAARAPAALAAPSLQVDVIVAWARLQLMRAVLRRFEAGAAFAEGAPLQGLFMHDAQLLAWLAAGLVRPQHTHRASLAHVETALAALPPPHQRSVLARLHERYAVPAVACDALALAWAWHRDFDTRQLAHALGAPRGVTTHLCSEVLAVHPRTEGTPDFAAQAYAWLWPAPTDYHAPWQLHPSVSAWLEGRDVIKALASLWQGLPLLVALNEPVPTGLFSPALQQRIAQLAAVPGARGALFWIHGPRNAGRLSVAQAVAAALGRPACELRAHLLWQAERVMQQSLWPAVGVAARLADAVIVVEDGEALQPVEGEAVSEARLRGGLAAALAQWPDTVCVASRVPSPPVELPRVALTLSLPAPDLSARTAAWLAMLADTPAAHAAPLLAARFVLGPDAIRASVAAARARAEMLGMAMHPEVIEHEVIARLTARLDAYGQTVTRQAQFADLIVPAEVADQLHAMIGLVEHRATILEQWGFGQHLGMARGVSALFAGPPGTGKTMAASVIASALGLDVVRIDLASVISKYVGETEKNLRRIFDEAANAQVMLLFDEADALFGKRTEVRSAQDRFANLEINYLLQRMDAFDGVSILTTNAKNAIDQALLRRLAFRIEFPEPEFADRLRLWQTLLPPATPVCAPLDFTVLAQRFVMTGGYIKNAIVRAAVSATRAGRALAMQDLLDGAHDEYAAMGKVMSAL